MLHGLTLRLALWKWSIAVCSHAASGPIPPVMLEMQSTVCCTYDCGFTTSDLCLLSRRAQTMNSGNLQGSCMEVNMTMLVSYIGVVY